MLSATTDSVSENLRPRHARGPALKGRKASRGQSGARNRLGLKVWGSCQYRANINKSYDESNLIRKA